MIKRFIFFLFLISLLGGLLFTIFQKLGEQSKVYQKPFNYFPPNPALFIEVVELSKTIHHFFETSMIWSKFEQVSQKSRYKSTLEHISKIISDSSYNEIFNEGTTNISIYNSDDDITWIIAKNIYSNDLNDKINLDSNFFSFCFFKINYPFLVISNSKTLIESFSNNYNNSDENPNFNMIKDKMIFSSKMSNISCFMDVEQFHNLLDNFLPKDNSSSFFQKIKSKKWIQFDVDFTPNDIKIVGISNPDSMLSLPMPNYYSFNDWIPKDIEFLEKKIIKVFNDSIGNNFHLKSLKLKFSDDIVENNHELLVIENPVIDLKHKGLEQFFLHDTVFYSNNDNDYRILDTTKLKPIFPKIIFKNKLGFLKEKHLIITSLDSKIEFDILVSQSNLKQLNTSIFNTTENEEFDQSHSEFLYQSRSQLLNEFKFSNYKFDSIVFNFFESIGGVSWTLNNYDNRVHHGVKIKKYFPKKVDKKILWKTLFPQLTWGPYSLDNHRTGTKDIIVQDTNNIIYLISAGGKIKWSKKIEEKIIGKINQVDAYNNNKYQMIFNTNSKLHIIDILGNEIDGFPVTFSFSATNSVAILDYDNNNDYRFLIAGDDYKIHNYSIDGLGVNGWTFPKMESKVKRPVSYFAINGLDYLMTTDESGTIKLFNRRGIERYSINNKIKLANSGKLAIIKSFNIDSSSVVYQDSLNGISKLTFGAGIKKLYDENTDSSNLLSSWELYSNENLKRINYCLKTNENLKIIDQNNEVFEFPFFYPYSILHNSKLGNYLIVLNKITNEVQLIDSKYSINPNLFRASKMTCIDDINNDNSKELITIINNNILVCYQIPSIN
jgi:hypothetical protein